MAGEAGRSRRSGDRTDVRRIAIIPARGGSKGIKNKNLAPLNGKPLLVHTIDHALQSKVVDEIYVSTEDWNIAAVASTGAKVIARPKEIAQDFSRSEEAIRHVLEEIKADLDDVVIFYQCTSPLRADHHTDEAYYEFLKYDLDSMFSACKTHQFTWRNGKRCFYDYRDRPMRQQKIPVVLENGSFYISKVWCYLQYNNRLAGNIGHYLQPWAYGIEIDDWEDLKQCGLMMQYGK